MKNINELLEKKYLLQELIRMLDNDAPFHTEEGRVYAQTLVKLVQIEMQIEATKKEKAAQ